MDTKIHEFTTENADINCMKRISVIAFAICAVLCVPQFAAAQPFPAPAGDLFTQEGIASWYGPEFDGRPTASGEIFNSSLLTAAHPTLPFGTILLVTNKHNNRQVAVKVNDRGPFVATRIIDVSKAAAEQLDMLVTGTAPVFVEVIQIGQTPQETVPLSAYQPQIQPPVYQQPPAWQQQPSIPPQPHTQPPAPAPIPQAAPEPPSPYPPITVTVYPSGQTAPSGYSSVNVFSQPPQAPPSPENTPPAVSGARLIPAMNPLPDKSYKLQVGSYKIARNAVDAYVELQKAGLNPEYERYGDFYRVVLKNIRGGEVQSVADKLELAGFKEAIIKEE